MLLCVMREVFGEVGGGRCWDGWGEQEQTGDSRVTRIIFIKIAGNNTGPTRSSLGMQCEKRCPQIITRHNSCLIYPAAILSRAPKMGDGRGRSETGPKITAGSRSKTLQNGARTRRESGSVGGIPDMFRAASHSCNIAALAFI